jgi:excisionase family DNA binding protein
VDEATAVEINSGGARKGFYTVSEAAKVLGVGQRRVLEMLETKEIEGERDPASSRWRIPKRAIHGLAPGEPPDSTKEPPLSEEPPVTPPVTEKDTVELQAAEETQATEEMALDDEGLPFASQPPREDPTERSSVGSSEETRERIGELERLYERLQLEQQAKKAEWQEERESLLAAADRALQRAEALQEEAAGLRTELETSRKRIGELESSNEHLQYQQEAEKASWQEDKRALLAAANREQQLNGALQKEVAKLRTELEESWGLTSKLEGLNDRLQHSQQSQKAEWRKEKESLLAALDRERQHAEELQGEVERLRDELQTERKKPSWRRLFRT